jgi:hypothetical protein
MDFGRMVAMTGMLALAACGGGAKEAGSPPGDIFSNALVPAPSPPPAEQHAPPPMDAWIGRWAGPEGLFLDIAGDPAGSGQYALTIKADLDSRGDRYPGTAEGATIRFARGGKEQTIRAGNGAETGFKWLADKKDCLIVVAGTEGYCRD